MKWKLTKYWYLGLTLVVLMHGPVLAESSALEDLKAELSNIAERLQKNSNKIKEKQQEKHQVQQSLGSINRELKILEHTIQKQEKAINVVASREQQTSQSIVQAQEQFNAKKAQFQKRLRQIYKNEHMGFLEFLLSPKDILSVLDSQYYFERIMKQDVNLVNEIRAEYHKLNEKKQQLSNEKKKLTALNQSVIIQEKSLERKKDQKNRYIDQLEDQIARMERENEELEAESNQLTSFIVARGNVSDGYFGTNRMIKPADAWVSSGFGYRTHPIFKRRILHRGIDLAAKKGSPIKAADSGMVIVAGQKARYNGFGIVTVIDHGRRKSDGKRISTVYAHQSRLLVKEGDFVTKGTVIGLVGSTGYSTGPHLHFEVRVDGVPVDPADFLNI
jgi:murein DD-endopeptidase MepM/ murein hydrolase activator NlpD